MTLFKGEKASKRNPLLSGNPSRSKNISCHLTAFIFAVFMVLGESFYQTNSWALVFGSVRYMVSSLVRVIFWDIIFYIGISFIFRKLDSGCLFKAPVLPERLRNNRYIRKICSLGGRYAQLVVRYPFRTVFVTLLIINIPYMVVSYPGIFMGDSATQIAQYPFQTSELSNHHPVMHTLFLGFCLNIGGMAGSWNLGGLIFCLVQTLLMFAAMAYGIKTLVEIGANKWVYVGIVVYYIIHPRISAYLFLVSKDILYADFLTLFYIAFFRLIQNKIPKRKRDFLILGIASVGMIMTRNDGVYVIVLTLLLALLYKPFRKKALAFIAVAVFTYTMLNQVLYPLMNVTPGSIREMLSVPFQQTARYIRDYEEDITEEEIEVIDKVLDYDVLADSYDPDLSDAVKATYHGTNEDLMEYFGVWFQMLLRHPGVYIQATMNNYYQYFYPGETIFNNYSYSWSEEMMDGLNESFGSEFHFPEIWDTAKETLETVREDFFTIPVLSLLNKPATYTWAAILFIVYCLRRKSLVGFIFSMPMIVQMLIFITGPTNGYYCRYEYPMLVYLPAAIVMGMQLIGEKSTAPQPSAA